MCPVVQINLFYNMFNLIIELKDFDFFLFVWIFGIYFVYNYNVQLKSFLGHYVSNISMPMLS